MVFGSTRRYPISHPFSVLVGGLKDRRRVGRTGGGDQAECVQRPVLDPLPKAFDPIVVVGVEELHLRGLDRILIVFPLIVGVALGLVKVVIPEDVVGRPLLGSGFLLHLSPR